MTDARDLLRLESQFCFSLYSAAHAVMRAYRPLLEALGLTYPQYLVMLVLWEQPEQTVGGIADRLLLESSTLTPLLKRLEAMGLINRRRNPANERQLIVTLTGQGRELRAKAESIPAAILCASGHDLPNLLRLRDELVVTRDSFAGATGDEHSLTAMVTASGPDEEA
ncbi:MarR family transcriptional regulator [Ancylobacter sp. A5.8]|uniref:MarR family winged helix-turn-helix transcriptional regulator n=1 Tax=Ancylobacter gelatini TaxID=2919920 RepID=UPI001F4EC6F8|nr:MarR family transcriptional regulator [Ancylobacter gelatini]MCJ8141433.1 MarR family transcriptional regulator [Ancylobacter gelatini]